jgi:preprotein translocase subunit SecY
MTKRPPPILATWILKRFGDGNEALIGDLIEEHGRRQSSLWYWRQVLIAVAVAGARQTLIAAGVAIVIALGAYVPIPGAHAGLLDLASRPAAGSPAFQLLALIPGWQLSGMSIFALGIMPYVTAAFIAQLTAFLWSPRHPAREKRPFPFMTIAWCLAIPLCVLQAVGLAMFLEGANLAGVEPPLVNSPGWVFRLTMAFAITTGTAILMFVSDQITRRRLGNGMFLVFAAAVLAALPVTLGPLVSGMIDPLALLRAFVLNVAIVAVISHFYRRAIEFEARQRIGGGEPLTRN